MPDFDPKSIPTLDDVIEPVEHEEADSENNDSETESIVVEDEPVLFTAEPVVDFTDEPEIEGAELESESSFNLAEEDEETESDLDDVPSELTLEEDSENFESALIDYDTEESISSETESPIEETSTDEQLATTQSPTLISETDLQSISDEIVLQLMPELEQRLRVLVRQVLKDKLPPEVTRFDSPPTTNNDD